MRRGQSIAITSLLAVAPVSAGVTGCLELRITTPIPEYLTDGITLDADQPLALDLYVQARVVDDPEATGITSFDGWLTASDGVDDPFDYAVLTVTEFLGLEPGGPTDIPHPAGYCGLFVPYRATVPIPCPSEEYQDGAFTFLAFDQDIDGNGEGIDGSWADVFKFRWVSDDPTDRVVTLAIDSTGFAYQSTIGLRQTRCITGGEFRITIGEPVVCHADYDGNGEVRVTDLLIFLDDWLRDDVDITGDGRTTVLDLLIFIEDFVEGC